MKKFDVIVVGGGNAGLEAAHISAKLGAKTLLATMKFDNLGELSCNPSIGGIGKGTIVREIDALGGLMSIAADQASIHTKILNKSKGPAVWGLRAQIDRKLYKQAVQSILNNTKNLKIIEGIVTDVSVFNDKFEYIIINGEKIKAKNVIITTGTFLNGKILRGQDRNAAGRINEAPSIELAQALKTHNLIAGRLKTGTPPRIYRDSINYDDLEKQYGENPPEPFSYITNEITREQIYCSITHTNSQTHKVILDAKDQSPVFTGLVASKGPRYCPSIEDKIRRFGDRNGHQIFLEPEGLDSNIVYPAGVSTSMPKEIQEKWIRTVKGFENCKIAEFGYVIEYDYINSQELKKTLESKKIQNVYFAGQINGTTGYEEAAGQGIVAGINAALSALDSEKEFIVSRTNSFIGVMIDDLTTLGIDNDPYRMFTSRSEYRLSIRHDNADIRLSPKAIDLGLFSNERIQAFNDKLKQIDELKMLLSQKQYSPNELVKYNINLSQDGIKRTLLQLLSHKDINFNNIEEIEPLTQNFSKDVNSYIETEQTYASFIKKQNNEIELINRTNSMLIPKDINYSNIKSLSNEVIEKLNKYKPQNVGDVAKISGITQAAIIAIINYINKQ